MTAGIELDEWLFVLVEKSQNGEQIIAQLDTEHDIRFIPTFKDRGTAQIGAGQLGIKTPYEIQAIIYEDLLQYAGQNQTLIILLDNHGNPLLKIAPDGRNV
jgi:hypothetical protein